MIYQFSLVKKEKQTIEGEKVFVALCDARTVFVTKHKARAQNLSLSQSNSTLSIMYVINDVTCQAKAEDLVWNE